LIAHLREIEPTMDIMVVGEAGAPAKGTPDPDVLLFAEASGRAILSGDRSTMPQHLADHFQAGHHTAGLILLRSGFSVGRYATEVRLIWFATTSDEWVDRTDYIPY
jgi:hypothetical protein